jgi:hypothetical protein
MRKKIDFKSQLGQDKWIIKKVFPGKKEGFFVEFGADNGINISNTYVLEKHFSWHGICAEPGLKFAELKKNRKCFVSNSLVWSSSGKTKYFLIDPGYSALSGIVDFLPKKETEGKIMRLKTISLHDLLKKYKAPKYIDYLSIDTEGSEYEIIKKFPFSEYTFGAITIEHNCNEINRKKIFDLLESHGYERVISQGIEDWYVNRKVNYVRGMFDIVFYLKKYCKSAVKKVFRPFLK